MGRSKLRLEERNLISLESVKILYIIDNIRLPYYGNFKFEPIFVF